MSDSTIALATVQNANGSSSFSFATVRAHFRSEGYAGKKLSAKVSAAMSECQAALVAGIAGTVSQKNMAVESVRTLKSGKLAVTYATPKVDKDKRISALEAELEELRALRSTLEAKVNARLVAENAPEEPATAVGAALETAGL